MEGQNQGQSRKPNREIYKKERQKNLEARQEEDLYELLKREREGALGGVAGNSAKKRQTKSRKTSMAAFYEPSDESYAGRFQYTEEMPKTKEKPRAGRKKPPTVGPSAGAVVALLMVALLVIVAGTAFSVAGQYKKDKTGNGQKPSAGPTVTGTLSEEGEEMRAILEAVDTENMTMRLWDVERSESVVYSYNSATDIRSKYDRVIVAGQLETGTIVNATYIESKKKLTRVYVDTNVWEMSGLKGLLVSADRKMITLHSKNYSYSDALHVFDSGIQTTLTGLIETDLVTVWGIDTEILVIRVDYGHGYLAFKEADDFIGGNLYLNKERKAQITEQMKLAVPEGSYELMVENQELSGEMKLEIKRNQITYVDLLEYSRKAEPVGQVIFQIEPMGAILYVDGEQTYYRSPVSLSYGNHQIRVESGGYATYEGRLSVTEAAMTVNISLGEYVPEGNGEEETKESEEQSGAETGKENENPDSYEDNDREDTTSGTSLDNALVDSKHSIFVYSDDDVEIYLDGTYMGVVCDGVAEFPKYIGRFTLELVNRQNTKTYTIQVDDDQEDFIFRRYFD